MSKLHLVSLVLDLFWRRGEFVSKWWKAPPCSQGIEPLFLEFCKLLQGGNSIDLFNIYTTLTKEQSNKT